VARWPNEDAKRLATSPRLEGFRARGIEVLLLADPVDTFWVSTALGYDGKPFKSVTQGAADISPVPMAEGQEAPAAGDVKPEVATLLALMKQTLGDVEDVCASERLSDSPVSLIAPEHGPDRRLARILAELRSPVPKAVIGQLSRAWLGSSISDLPDGRRMVPIDHRSH
jgi:molecular chaperone HtpG